MLKTMLRHLIEPFITKYGSSKAAFDGTLKVLFLGTVNNSRNIVKDVAMASTVCLYKRNERAFTGVCSGVGLLSGCCFSKSSSESDPIFGTTEDLVTAVEENVTTSEKLNIATQSLLSGIKNDLLHSNEDLLDSFIKPESSDIKDKPVENKANSVIDMEVQTKRNNDVQKDNNAVLSEHGGAIDDNIVYEPAKKTKRQKLNTKTMHSRRQDGSDLHTGDGKRKERPVKVQPNYFVAFQISNPEILGVMSEVQRHIIEQDKRLAPSLISISKSHITLMVMRFDNEEEHSKAIDILKIIHKDINESISKDPLKLCFKGIGNFRNKVVFVKLQQDDALLRLQAYAERISNHFEAASIMSTDVGRGFNPHLTLMKLSKDPTLFRKGIRKINPSLYGAYEDHSFGTEVVKSIQLLSMIGPPDENGYYMGTDLPFDV